MSPKVSQRKVETSEILRRTNTLGVLEAVKKSSPVRVALFFFFLLIEETKPKRAQGKIIPWHETTKTMKIAAYIDIRTRRKEAREEKTKRER